MAARGGRYWEYQTMQASLDNLKMNGDAVLKARKEKGFYRQASVIDSRDGTPVVTARWYWPGRDGTSRCYCCVWIHGYRRYSCRHDGSGGGYAGGGGYHKPSAALAAALAAAGVELSDPIDGRGESAEDAALIAVAKSVVIGNSRYREWRLRHHPLFLSHAHA